MCFFSNKILLAYPNYMIDMDALQQPTWFEPFMYVGCIVGVVGGLDRHGRYWLPTI